MSESKDSNGNTLNNSAILNNKTAREKKNSLPVSAIKFNNNNNNNNKRKSK